jgi:hypothetical protein
VSRDRTLAPAYKMLLSLPNELSSRGLWTRILVSEYQFYRTLTQLSPVMIKDQKNNLVRKNCFSLASKNDYSLVPFEDDEPVLQILRTVVIVWFGSVFFINQTMNGPSSSWNSIRLFFLTFLLFLTETNLMHFI